MSMTKEDAEHVLAAIAVHVPHVFEQVRARREAELDARMRAALEGALGPMDVLASALDPDGSVRRTLIDDVIRRAKKKLDVDA